MVLLSPLSLFSQKGVDLIVAAGIEDVQLFHCSMKKYMWLSVIQTQQRECVGMCLCLCMPVCTCVAQCASLHAQVCVHVSVCECDCVCNVSHAASLCVYNIELTAGTAEIFSFSVFRSLWKQSN